MIGSETSWKLGCLFGGIGVGLGAFGAHALKKIFVGPDGVAKASNWSTATSYLFIHSLALLGTSLKQKDDKSITPLLFSIGIIAFSGSIYLLSVVKSPIVRKILGPTTPIGGLFFIAGWISAFNQ